MIKLAIIGLPLLLGAISTPAVENESYQVNEVSSQVQPKKVAYNDSQYIITLSVNEVNNYYFDNLKTYLLNYDYSNYTGPIEIDYDSSTYTYDEFVEDNSGSYICFRNGDSNNIVLGDYDGSTNTSLFGFYLSDNTSERSLFTSDITLDCDSTAYSSIKSAIELDIIENSKTMPTISQMFGVVADALQAFATTLGSAFSSVTALFWDSTASAPTFLGMLSLAVLGAGLIYLAFNLIRGLIRRIRG